MKDEDKASLQEAFAILDQIQDQMYTMGKVFIIMEALNAAKDSAVKDHHSGGDAKEDYRSLYREAICKKQPFPFPTVRFYVDSAGNCAETARAVAALDGR